MKYSMYFSPCFVYLVKCLILTLIGSPLTNGLECYNHTDTDTTTTMTTEKSDGCFIDKDTKKRGPYEGGAFLTLEPENTHCGLHRGQTRCYCYTDLCNKDFPSPQPDIQRLSIDSIMCVQHPQDTCKGNVCTKSTFPNSEPFPGCLKLFFGKKKNGCVKKAYLPHSLTRMCFCETNMCDPFALSDLNETNNESQHTTDPSEQSDSTGTTLYIINVLMMVFLVWMVSE